MRNLTTIYATTPSILLVDFNHGVWLPSLTANRSRWKIQFAYSVNFIGLGRLNKIWNCKYTLSILADL
jgi:hypothetical protein